MNTPEKILVPVCTGMPIRALVRHRAARYADRAAFPLDPEAASAEVPGITTNRNRFTL